MSRKERAVQMLLVAGLCGVGSSVIVTTILTLLFGIKPQFQECAKMGGLCGLLGGIVMLNFYRRRR